MLCHVVVPEPSVDADGNARADTDPGCNVSVDIGAAVLSLTRVS